MKKHLRVFSTTALISVVINILMLTGPLFMLQVYDRVLTSGSVPTLSALIVIVGVLYIFMGVLEWIRARVMSRIARRWDEDQALPLFKSVLADEDKLPQSAKTFPPLRDIDIVRNFMSGPGPLSLFDAPWVPIYIAVIFVLHPYLGWFSVAAVLFLIALMLTGRWATKNCQTEAAAMHEAAHSIAQEAGSQTDFVKAIALYDGLSERWKEHHNNGLSMQQFAGDRASFYSGLTKSARLFLQAGILASGALLAIQGELSAGSIVTAAIILSRGLAPVEQIVSQWRSFAVAHAAWTRLQQLPPAATGSNLKTRLPSPKGKLTVDNITCFVPDLADPLVANLKFQLEPGDSLGVIGPSGAGKSTLLKAILGTWPLVKGEVRLDGADFNQWDRTVLAKHLGYVPQDIVLFTGTIAQNISRFLPDSSSELIVEAAKLAQVHDMIVTLPQGYDTIVGPRGLPLSAGQRQRVALACAFYGRPRLIVLDEPNSNLDESGDKALSKALKAMSETGSTIILATHKMAAVAEMEKVLVLREGRQLAFGSKDQIGTISSGGRFSVVQGGPSFAFN